MNHFDAKSLLPRPHHGFQLLLVILTTTLAIAQTGIVANNGLPPPAEKQFRFAKGLLERGFYDMAKDEFTNYLKNYAAEPQAPAATFYLIKCLTARQEFDEARIVIKYFLDRWPLHALAARIRLMKGDLLLRQNQFADAAETFSELSANPNSVIREAALYFQAQALAAGGNLAEATAIYQNLSELPFDGEHLYRPYAAFALAVARHHQGKPEPAKVSYLKLMAGGHVPDSLREEAVYRLAENAFASENYSEAVAFYRQLIQQFPNGLFASQAYQHLVRAYLADDKPELARQTIRQWQEAHPGQVNVPLNYLHGLALIKSNLIAPARDIFAQLQKMTDIPPEYRRLAQYQEIFCLSNLEKYEAAVELARDFMTNFPQTAELPDVRYFQGAAYYAQAQYKAAATVLREAFQAQPKDWKYKQEARLKLADSLRRLDQAEAAAELYRQMAENASAAEAVFFRLTAGDLAAKAGDRKAAILDYRAVIAAAPPEASDRAAAILHLARLYTEIDELNEAEKVLATGNLEDHAEAGQRSLLLLGFIKFQQGKHAEAEQHLRAALPIIREPKRVAEARHLLAVSLLEQDKMDDSLAIVSDLVKLPPEVRPALREPLLYRLLELAYTRHNYDVCENIARLLVNAADPLTAHYATLRLAAIMAAGDRLEEARKLLDSHKAKLPANTAISGEFPGPVAEAQVAAALGEIHLRAERYDPAVREFQKALTVKNLDAETLARAHWGLAHVMARENRDNEALRHATNAFVLTDNPPYTPDAMIIALKLMLKLQRPDEAAATWRELRTRYPVYAEQHADKTEFQVFKKSTNPQPAP